MLEERTCSAIVIIDGTAINLNDEGRARVMKTMSWSQPTQVLHPFPLTPLERTSKPPAALRTVLLRLAGLAHPIDRIGSAPPAPYARIIVLDGMAPIMDALRVIPMPPLVIEPAQIRLPPVPSPWARYPRFLTKPRLLTRFLCECRRTWTWLGSILGSEGSNSMAEGIAPSPTS